MPRTWPTLSPFLHLFRWGNIPAKHQIFQLTGIPCLTARGFIVPHRWCAFHKLRQGLPPAERSRLAALWDSLCCGGWNRTHSISQECLHVTRKQSGLAVWRSVWTSAVRDIMSDNGELLSQYLPCSVKNASFRDSLLFTFPPLFLFVQRLCLFVCLFSS